MKWPNKKYKIGENHLCKSVFFVTQISQMTQIFFLMGFFFIGFHGNYSEVDCWDDYSRIFADATCPVVADTPWGWKKSHRFHRYTQIFLGTFFCYADFADDADFFSWDFYSSDDTEFIRRLTAETITHGFSRMRPVRSLQIPPESGKCPTDFTDLHRFFLGCFFVTQISQMTQIFSHGIFLFIGRHGIYSEVSCCGDYSRIFADATCPVVADTPWDWTKRFTRDSIENLCKSVKSVGQNPSTKKNLRHLRNLRDKKQQEHI